MDWKTKLWLTLMGAAVIAAILLILALLGVDISNIRITKGFFLG